MRRYRIFIPYVLRQWPWLIGIVVLTVFSSTLAALRPWPLKLLVDYALSDTRLPQPVLEALQRLSVEPSAMMLVGTAALAGILLFVFITVVEGLLSLAWVVTSQRMAFDLSTDLFERLLRLSLRFHANRRVGDMISRVSGDAWCVTTVSGLVVSPIQQAITFVAMGYVAWNLDPALASMTLMAAPLLGASAWFFGPAMKSRARAGREAESGIASLVQQTLSTIPVVRAFGGEQRNDRRFDALADDAVSAAKRGALVNSSYGVTNGLILAIGTALVLYLGGVRVLTGAISLGTLLVFLTYIRTLQGASRGVFDTFSKVKTAEARMDRVLEILGAEDDQEVIERPGALPLRLAGSGRGCPVRFEKVTFGYEADRPVLREVTLAVEPGEKIALVGPTGAGKSTMVSLLPRFYDPWRGTVSIAGSNLRDLQLGSLRAKVSVLLQEPFLLPITVAANIGYGRMGASRDDIVAAATAAGCDEFIRRLPDGYDTNLSEQGGNLSTGERQRLAIARALIKGAPVLVLDEPTAALDVGTEATVVAAINRLLEGRTAFIIAHRLSTIERADRIVYLDEGRIIEEGSHAQLMARHGMYREMFESQYGALSQEVRA